MDADLDASPTRGADSRGDAYWDWLAVLLRRRRLILGMILLAGAAAAARGLLRPRTYVAQATFTVQSTRNARNSNLASLVAGTGLDLPQLTTGGTQFFFGTLVTADVVLRQVVSTEFETLDGSTGNLVEVMNVRGETYEERVDRAVRRVRGAVTTRMMTRPSLVSFSVETRWPDVSLAITEMILDKVSSFTVRETQSKGRAERMFLEERIAEAQHDVREWEDSLQAFLAGNRQFGQYSQQRFEHDRLLAELQRHRAIYSSLTQNREQALLTEIRDGSTITVLRSPRLPLRSRPRLRLFHILAAGMFGAVVGVVLACVAEMWSRSNARAISVVQRSLPPSSVSARLLALAVGARAPRAASSVHGRYDS